MPSLPSDYTDATLTAFILRELGDVALALGWSSQEDIRHAIHRTLRLYGVASVALATDAAKLEALAALEAWRAASKSAAGRYNFEEAGAKYDRAALHTQIQKELVRAQADAEPYLTVGSGSAGSTIASGRAVTRASW